MPLIKIISDREIPDSFFSPRRTEVPPETVGKIISDVRSRGDEALREYSEQFDKFNPPEFEIKKDIIVECEARLKKQNQKLYSALCLSRDLGIKFALKQKECFSDFESEISPGLFTGQKNIAVERAGLYIPAGRFPLVSSVVMCTAPAKAAGVKEIIMCTPPKKNPEGKFFADMNITAAAGICGVDRLFAAGGAQAVAAMAYGTETIPKVNVIAGPGNKFVTAAKKAVYGDVGIDIPAGPSEVLIISDGSGSPEWTAADMLAQAEHDTAAQAVLITTDRKFARKTEAALEKMLEEKLPADSAARQSLPANGFIIIAENLERAAEIADKKAPEHLELAMNPGKERDKLTAGLRNYGSLFIGHKSAEVLGDYAAGLNHTLPTAGAAAFTGGLSVRHFMKTVTTLRCGEKPDDDLRGWKESIAAAETLAVSEGLTGHSLAAGLRKSGD